MLEDRGWSLDEAGAGLSGTDGYRLLTTLGVFMDAGEDRGRRALVVLREAGAAAALAAETGGELVELDHGRAFVLIAGAGVDRRGARCCVGVGAERTCTFVELTPSGARWHDRSRPTAWQGGDRLETWLADQRETNGVDVGSLTWRVRVGGVATLVTTESDSLEPGCGWRFVLDGGRRSPVLELSEEIEVELTRPPSCTDRQSDFPPIDFDLAVLER